MSNKIYNKSIKREILSSKARFISILSIIMLGVAIYLGIKSTGPDLKLSINEFFKSQNLMDSKIVSTIGLNDNDLKLLENNDKIAVYEAIRSMDINLTNTNNVVKFMEYNPNNHNVNKLTVVEGRLPENSGEIALDEIALRLNKDFKIGDTFTIESDEDVDSFLEKKSFKIVGFVQNPMFIDFFSRGNTTVGKGSIDYFAVLNSSDIVMDVYTEIYVKFKNVENVLSYSSEYEDLMEKNTEYLEDLYSARVIDRIEEIKLEALKEINKAYKEIEDGENELNKAEEELNKGKVALSDGIAKYNNGVKEFNTEIKNSELKLNEGLNAINKGQEELDNKKEELLNGEKQLALAKEELNKAKEEFISQGIDPTEDISKYENQIKELNTLILAYNSLSSDIKASVNNLSQGDSIPNEKIQYWKTIISNQSLGLNNFNNLISNLEQNPSDTTIALSLSQEIDKASDIVNKNKAPLETLVADISKYQLGVKAYTEQISNINNGKIQIEEAQKQLDKGKEEINKGKIILEQGKIKGQVELNKAKQELDKAEQDIANGQKEIDENRKKLIDGRKKVDLEKEKLNDLDDSKYFFFDRTDNSGYSSYKTSIESLDKIATVFPIFFFLVAALICLTTMTRMVEENRVETGTLKALGYTNLEVSKKFVAYSSLASIIGCITGVLVGSILIPNVIGGAYSSAFMLPKTIIKYYPSFIIQSLIASLVCTLGTVLIVLKSELKDNPSNLMRVKAPKIGKKILLERIKPLWNSFNFNQKVTFRNLFRYKQRMLMTILGVAGCMALLVTGMALDNSNSLFAEIQFNKLFNYDATVIFNDNTTEEDNIKYNEDLKSLNEYKDSLNVYQESITFSKKGTNTQTAIMYVPENKEQLNNYILLNNRVTKEEYTLSDNGAIITEKLAKILNASVGDTIILTDSNNNDYAVVVDKIIENYAGHYVYLSPNYYKKILGKEVEYNSQLLKFEDNIENEDNIATELMNNDSVINVTFTSKMRSMSESADLGLVVIVIIIASGSLAFVVLYNLININVSERIREISTIKVLGFHNNEVDMYIFRENIILTILGILAGTIMGKYLYLFIIGTSEMDNMMMIPTINLSSYIVSALITMIFAILVMIMMHKKLKNINMIDALKSVE